MTDSEVRAAGIALWNSLSFGTGVPEGLRIDREAFKIAEAATAEIVKLKNSRLDPDGNPLDLLAPTIWHALCLLVYFYVQTRLKDCTFDDPDILDRRFGTQVLYRGQARSWNILPTAWRFPNEQEWNAKRLEALARYWEDWTSPDHDLIFALFGRLDSPASVAAVAQHYGLPTNLVDFTFDPRIAVWFACCESESAVPPSSPEDTQGCAVIYFTSFYKFASVGSQRICLPHPAAKRIYHQTGCFADFGPRPDSIPDISNFGEPWMWVQENCFRLFFPRSYPVDSSLAGVAREWIYASDPFFDESIAVAKELDSTMLQDARSAANALGLRVKAKPSWRNRNELCSNFLYTDEEFWQLVEPLEQYLRMAALVHTRAGPKVDPWILAGLRKTNFDAANAILQVATLPYKHSPGLVWIADRIKESEKLLVQYLKKGNRHSGRNVL
jgi:hypothetical protein